MPYLRMVRQLIVALVVLTSVTTFIGAPASAGEITSREPLAMALPTITPVPQNIAATRVEVPISGLVCLVVGRATDPAARQRVTEVLEGAGASVIVVTAPATPRLGIPAVIPRDCGG